MDLINNIEKMKNRAAREAARGRTIGLVPTMGYLHKGHLSLVEKAASECDVVVVSIFVNPEQFAPDEDLREYPRDLERDRALAESSGADIVFAPGESAMYPGGYSTYVEVTGELTGRLCGKKRPGHFRGVTTVVTKLFNIVSPHRAYFGQKDPQQAVVVKRMVLDLNMDVDVQVLPIIREKDGLAMSSRNTYLSSDERAQARKIKACLEEARRMVEAGELSSSLIRKRIEDMLAPEESLRPDYIEIVDAEHLFPVDQVRDNTLIALAVFAGSTRLIDNTFIDKVPDSG